MGINGLLKALDNITIDRHLSFYRGKRMAVDGYCWLHKAVYLITSDILTNPGSKRYLVYLRKRLDHLLKYNITPIIVFDGDKLPMKKIEEEEREKHRNEVTIQSRTLLNQGLVREAQAKMIEGLDINPQMAYEFIKVLRSLKIEYYVAPYEADVQLAYLSKMGLVDCVITEDSDLIALGCKRVLFKLDPETDIGKEITYESKKKCKAYSFSTFSDDKFLTFCILAGCDYFKLKGVGIKIAYNAIKNVSSYTQCLALLHNKNSSQLPTQEIVTKFEKAFLTFKYQVVYCPIRKEMIYWNNPDEMKYKFLSKYKNDLSFLGIIRNSQLTDDIVYGRIDPITHKAFNGESVSTQYHNNNVYNIININKNEYHHMTVKILSTENENNEEHDKLFLNKKRNYEEDENYKEFELDMDLDIRNNEEERINDIHKKEKLGNDHTNKMICLSSDSSTPVKINTLSNNNSNILNKRFEFVHKAKTFKEDEHMFINNEDNIDDDSNSINALEQFDSFLDSFDKVDKKVKTNETNMENLKVHLSHNKVELIRIVDKNGGNSDEGKHIKNKNQITTLSEGNHPLSNRGNDNNSNNNPFVKLQSPSSFEQMKLLNIAV